MPDPSKVNRGEEFSRLLVANQKRILGFIYTLVQDRHAAQDVLQDVSATLWRKFDDFELGTDFGAWAMCVSRSTVLNWRRKQQKLPVALADETLGFLADEAVAYLSVPEDERRMGLEECLGRLPAKQRELIKARYLQDRDVAKIAKSENSNVRSIYLRLEKIHSSLLDCIENKRWKNPVSPTNTP
jgi:RNA polymerase sigma-70 factor (ECF subfamily)